ncbi:hypothetical protein GIB67_025236, partial [Kingdonia uniflora]
ETLGFTTYPAPYLSPEASGKNLLIGANFASAGSGYYAETTLLNNAISLREQLEHFKEYQRKLTKVAGPKKLHPSSRMHYTPLGFGFKETRKGCCGTGLFEFSLLCNRFSIGTCSNATDHVFWDGVHPSEATNMILADSLLTQGSPFSADILCDSSSRL